VGEEVSMGKRSESSDKRRAEREGRSGEKKPADLKPPKDKADAVQGGRRKFR